MDCRNLEFKSILFLVCAPGWTLFEPTGKCYRIYRDLKNWNEARRTCQEEGQNGDLASIPNQETNDFILSLDLRYKTHIGGHDYDEEGVWKWSDGTPWQYKNWDTNQPSNVGGRDYLAIWQVISGKWINEQGSGTKQFICQYKPG